MIDQKILTLLNAPTRQERIANLKEVLKTAEFPPFFYYAPYKVRILRRHLRTGINIAIALHDGRMILRVNQLFGIFLSVWPRNHFVPPYSKLSLARLTILTIANDVGVNLCNWPAGNP